jgi:hypothetical protein
MIVPELFFRGLLSNRLTKTKRVAIGISCVELSDPPRLVDRPVMHRRALMP